MHCLNCGQKLIEGARRCPGCHHYSLTFWLPMINAAAWLAVAALIYALFVCFVPVLCAVCAGLGADLPQLMLLNWSWSNFVYTYGIPILFVVAILLGNRSRWFSGFPKLGTGMTVFSSSILLLMTIFVAADGHYMNSFWAHEYEISEDISERDLAEAASLRALNTTRSLIIAEYRYRDLHPKAGFSCDFDSLEPLGGPGHGERVYGPTDSYTRRFDVYLISLRACQGAPVTNYELTTVPDLAFGTIYQKRGAYCSDGSGAVFTAEAGKAEKCLSARTPVR